MTWRTIGGILDMYMFMGPSPSEVIQQYTEVIGRSFMPPYWSLGFHVCKFGYKSVNETMDVVKRMKEAKIPQVWHYVTQMILIKKKVNANNNWVQYNSEKKRFLFVYLLFILRFPVYKMKH